MGTIGEWVIEEACRALASWPEPITLAINISPKQLLMPSLPNVVSRALSRYRVPGNRLELEVTEGGVIHQQLAKLLQLAPDRLIRIIRLQAGQAAKGHQHLLAFSQEIPDHLPGACTALFALPFFSLQIPPPALSIYILVISYKPQHRVRATSGAPTGLY